MGCRYLCLMANNASINICDMGIEEQLAEMRVAEFARKGKRLDFDNALVVVRAETYDEMIRIMSHDPEFSVRKISAFLSVSTRFVKISMARHGKLKMDEPESPDWALEQMEEVREVLRRQKKK
jgi:hypothetical protein